MKIVRRDTLPPGDKPQAVMFFPLPRCGVCGKTVDSMDISVDPLTRIWHLTACCHGDEETMVITDETVEDCEIGQGTAFAHGNH